MCPFSSNWSCGTLVFRRSALTSPLSCPVSVCRAQKSKGSHADSFSPANSLSTSNFSSHRTFLRVLVSKGMGPLAIYTGMEAIESICVDDSKKRVTVSRKGEDIWSWACPVTLWVCREVLWAILRDAEGSKNFHHRCYNLVNLLDLRAPSKRSVILFHTSGSYPQRICDRNAAIHHAMETQKLTICSLNCSCVHRSSV
jgi:hypothetical protein